MTFICEEKPVRLERGSERNIACLADLESDPIFLGPDIGQFSLDEVVDVFKCGHQSGTLVALDLGHSSDYVGVNLRVKTKHSVRL